MNRKKRILFCSEATFLNTGYATYTREIMNELQKTGKYELAEMASYGQRNDPRAANIPWKYYGVMPNTDCQPLAPKEEIDAYNSNGVNQFGGWIFEHVCLDFLPDIVCDIRDFWMLDFAERSPFRPYFKWALMPTVDARPQARQWIATYASADAVFTYSDWAGGVLKDQGGDKINYLGSAPPSAHPAYRPVEDKRAHKEKMGIDPDSKIIGTVMRNQRRKLYPDLFKAFRLFLDERKAAGDKTVYYLYCHTSYPDLGWEIPELILENEISSNVIFTYICGQTGKPFCSVYKGAVCQSKYTGRWGSTLSNVKNGVSYDGLSDIINCFDLYTQYANCEGFGLPQVEAAACGVPVCGTDYSAMESVLRKLGGYPIKPAALYKELETGCLRAVPDNEAAARLFSHYFSKTEEEHKEESRTVRDNFQRYYQWNISAQKWMDYFDSVEIDDGAWTKEPRIHQPHQKPDINTINTIPYNNQARWLLVNVLGEPERAGTFFESRLTRDLMLRSATGSTGGMYFNESSAAFDGQQIRAEFNFDIAYDQMKNLCERRNHWEKKRVEKIQRISQQVGQ